MISRQTEIEIKDNSGITKARVINSSKSNYNSKKAWGVGQCVKGVILKGWPKSKSKTRNKIKTKKLEDFVIIQRKKSIIRNDGSSLSFSQNSGVTVTISKDLKLQLSFKRINSAVSLEVKKIKAGTNLVKLAKSLI
jgi:ribosomal protein L14